MSNSFSFESAAAGEHMESSRWDETNGYGGRGSQVIGKKYEHSGKAPMESLVLAYIVGLICSAFSGIVYCYGVTTIEMILVEIVFLFLFAAGIGLPIGVIARKFKMRSDGHMFLVVILAATFGIYFCWAFHPYFAVGTDIAWAPGEIFQWAKVLFNKGEYGGWFAIAVWVGEIGVVYLMSLGFAFVQIDQPFCESCDCWTEKRETVACFGHPGIGTRVGKRLMDKDYLALLECIPSNNKANFFLKVDMDMCPQCLQTCTISCKEITNSINDKGEKEQREQPIFDKLVITPEDLQDIIAAGQSNEVEWTRSEL